MKKNDVWCKRLRTYLANLLIALFAFDCMALSRGGQGGVSNQTATRQQGDSKETGRSPECMRN